MTSDRSAATSGTGASGTGASASAATSAAVSASTISSTCSIGASGSSGSGFGSSTSPARSDRTHASSAFQTIAKLFSTSGVNLPDFASSAPTFPNKKNCSSDCDNDFKVAWASSSKESQKN